MKLTQRKPNPLAQRIPGESLAQQRLGEAFEDIDQLHARVGCAEQDLHEARAENRQLNEALEQTVAEYDAVAARVLPHLDSPTWPETDQPVEALIGDELAAELGYKGWG